MKKIILYLWTGFAVIYGNIASAQQALPYYTGFDNAAEKSGWQFFKLGVDATYGPWSISTGGFSNPNCIYHDYNNTDTVEDWYVSPGLKITEASKINLKIRPFAIMGNALPSDYIGIWYSSGSADPNMGQYKEVANLTGLTTSANSLKWVDTTVSLPFQAGTGYIGFKYKNVNNWFTISLDNIKVSALTSGIEKVKEQNKVSVFPNPCNGIFNIAFSNPDDVTRIEVYNTLGSVVFQLTAVEAITPIDLSNQPKGLYMVKVIACNNSDATRKLTLQ